MQLIDLLEAFHPFLVFDANVSNVTHTDFNENLHFFLHIEKQFHSEKYCFHFFFIEVNFLNFFKYLNTVTIIINRSLIDNYYMCTKRKSYARMQRKFKFNYQLEIDSDVLARTGK